MIDLDDLKEKAKAATAGPWFDDSEWSPDDVSIWSGKRGDSSVFLGNIGGARFVEVGVAFDANTANGQFIAAANPAVVLDLIERLEAAKALAAANIGKLTLQAEDILKVQVPPAQFSKYWIGGYAIDQLRRLVPRDCEVLIYPIGADIERMEESAIRKAGWVKVRESPFFDTKLGEPYEPPCPSSLHDIDLSQVAKKNAKLLLRATDADLDAILEYLEDKPEPPRKESFIQWCKRTVAIKGGDQ
jgi:hypothetical protein